MKSETTTESRTEAGSSRGPLWATQVATFFGAGRISPGPGSWGSLSAILVWLVVARRFSPKWQPEVLAVLIVGAIAIGIPAASRVAEASGIEDPQFVVIDEVVGQWIALLFVPLTWKTVAVGFILFRGFDIVKPPPVRQLERLPAGTGIVADDVAAGAYALVIMQLLLRFGLLSP